MPELTIKKKLCAKVIIIDPCEQEFRFFIILGIMALDFHRLDNSDYLFGLETAKYNRLEEIFETFKHWTGLAIDPYTDNRLSVDHQKVLLRIIDDYVAKTDLNKDKSKTTAILEFRGLLAYLSTNNWEIELLGD